MLPPDSGMRAGGGFYGASSDWSGLLRRCELANRRARRMFRIVIAQVNPFPASVDADDAHGRVDIFSRVRELRRAAATQARRLLRVLLLRQRGLPAGSTFYVTLQFILAHPLTS